MPIHGPNFLYMLVCDECGCKDYVKPRISEWWISIHGMEMTAVDVAKEMGWSFDEYDCYCPECTKKKEEKE